MTLCMITSPDYRWSAPRSLPPAPPYRSRTEPAPFEQRVGLDLPIAELVDKKLSGVIDPHASLLVGSCSREDCFADARVAA